MKVIIKQIKLILVTLTLISSAKAQQQAYPYLNTKFSIDERVDDLVSRMTLKEKALQLFNQAPAIERLGVPAYDWWNECLHGVARAGKATVFPQAIGMAATFDKNLMLRIGTAISDEARAKHHDFARNNARSIYMGLTFWTPNINIFRDPRWGRGQETYGEDPYLTGRMAVNFINGLQGNDPKYLKLVATAKHYAVHSGPEYSRHVDNFYVNDRDLYDTYLPAFKATIQEANVQSIMCAYNRFRDKPCCGSDVLLSNILRKQFGFNGYVVSDCGAITDFFQKGNHHLVETPAQAWGWSLSSGTDLNCEENKAFIEDHFEEAVRKGIINENDINISVKRLFKARFMLGVFDPEDEVGYTKIPMSVVGSKDHLNLSLEAAEKSFVLLKNNGILPLKNVKKIALIGPNSNNPTVLTGNYNGDPINPVTPLQAFQQKLGSTNIFYTPGTPIVPGIYTDYTIVGENNLYHEVNGKLLKGLQAAYYEDVELNGVPKITRIDKTIDFVWYKSPINQLVDESFGVKWTGFIIPENTANYFFSTNLKLKINDLLITDSVIKLLKGTRYKLDAVLKVKATSWMSNHQQQHAHLSWVNTSRNYRQEAMDAAKNADVIVFCGGISPDLEGEEMKIQVDGFSHGDRTNINLPKVQEDLLKELFNTGKPIIYVNFSGSAIALNWQNEKLPAIVQAFYPGEATGTALVRLLFGEYNPSGRLPVTFYKSIEQLPDFKNYEMAGRTYRYFKGDVLYPFGYGLSYAGFSYNNLKFSSDIMKAGQQVEVTVDVTNTGIVKGDEVVQLYVSDKATSVLRPSKELKGFERISLDPGQTKTVKFVLDTTMLSYWSSNMEYSITSGGFVIMVGKSSVEGVTKTLKVQ